MTKTIRIENADTSNYVVVVEVYDKGLNGAPDVLADTKRLEYPTAMTDGIYITSTRYLVVREET